MKVTLMTLKINSIRFSLKKALVFLSILITQVNYAQIKKITIEVENYDNDTIQLGYYLGDKTYLKPDAITDSDVLKRQSDGKFLFNYEGTLEPGIYLIVLNPDKKYAEIIVPESIIGNLQITLSAQAPRKTIKVKGDNGENDLFYSYINFLNEKRLIAREYQEDDDIESLNKLNDEVRAFQEKFISTHKNKLVSKIVNAKVQIETPKFEGTKEEVQLKKWKYLKSHYFDNVDLANPAMLRTSFLYNIVNTYIERLTIQHPDSISNSIDFILTKMKPSQETYKYYVIDFLNKYAKSNLVGMDAVYVHMANQYYANGKAPWTKQEQLNKILINAKALEPILIGKTAPNIKLEQANGIGFHLHDLQSKFTILLFWGGRGNSILSTTISDIKKHETSLKELGVEIVSIFTGNNDAHFKDFTKNKNMVNWINTKITDKKSRAFKNYRIRTFLQTFLLDKNKKIVSKYIGGDQILEVINRFNK